MKRFLLWPAGVVLGLGLVFLGLVLGTRGDYPVAPLVTADPARPSVLVDGVRLHLRVVDGPEGAPTILVLHGGPGGDFRSLQALDALSDQYRIVYYDQRGAGLSERVAASRLTLDGYLRELAGVIDLVSPETPPILIGHSWGAMLAAAYMGETPSGVARAVLIEPGYLDAAGRAAWEARSQTYMSGPGYGVQAVLTGFRAQHVTGPDAEAAQDYLVGHMVGVFANHPDNPYHCGTGYSAPSWRFGALASATWRAAPDADMDRIGSRLAGFAGPVLLLSGACNDWLGPLQDQHQTRFQSARHQGIPAAGHDVIWDNPAASLAAIRAFLDEGAG